MTEQVRLLFEENVLGTLATVNDDGSPWSTPLHIVTDGKAIYWFSKETTRHSQNIERDRRVSVSLFSPDESKGPKGVYINGKVEALAGEQDQYARKVAASRLGSLPPLFDTARAYRLYVGEYNEDRSTGTCWYFYS